LDDSEQDVLGLDLARSPAGRFSARKADNHAGARSEGDSASRARPLLIRQLVGKELPANAERFQGTSSSRVSEGVQRQDKMLCADVIVVKRTGFGLGLLKQVGGSRGELEGGRLEERFDLSTVLTLEHTASSISHGFLLQMASVGCRANGSALRR
jgi:hypothetical protein